MSSLGRIILYQKLRNNSNHNLLHIHKIIQYPLPWTHFKEGSHSIQHWNCPTSDPLSEQQKMNSFEQMEKLYHLNFVFPPLNGGLNSKVRNSCNIIYGWKREKGQKKEAKEGNAIICNNYYIKYEFFLTKILKKSNSVQTKYFSCK